MRNIGHLASRLPTTKNSTNFKSIGKNVDTYFYIMTYISKNIFFGFSEVRIIVIWMRTWMNNSIHVQVQIIKVRNLKFNGDETK